VIVLVRHGETDYNREPVRVQGRLDVPLNDSGRAQAQAIAVRLANETDAPPFGALYSSGLSRARETAQIIGAALGLQPQADPRFAESDRGAWEGRTWAEIRRDDPDNYKAWRAAGPAFRFPGGESLSEQQRRVVAALDDVREAELPVLVACHGGTIRVALCHVHGVGLEAFHDWDVPNGALIRL
jgi:2,3-bisphosphoglycerate-dependent phosphoglycerate mutase